MLDTNIENVYKIERDRLISYYERIKSQYTSSSVIENLTKLLFYQSVNPSITYISSVLEYYESKLKLNRNLIDLALEWIRAQNVIRLEYKKYLIRAQYPPGLLTLAIDDCISCFFLEYDEFIRKLLREDILEYEISALYHIFFSIAETDIGESDLSMILEWYKSKVPTNYRDNKKINTNLITLRSVFSLIILKDYEAVISSRQDAQKISSPFEEEIGSKQSAQSEEFKGPLLERMFRTYSINPDGFSSKEMERGVEQFLSSYFKFGKFYNFEDFRPDLIFSLATYIYSGLTDETKQKYPIIKLKMLISNLMEIIKDTNKFDLLDGVAWITDLKPYIKIFLLDLSYNLFLEKPRKLIVQEKETQVEKIPYDFESNFNLTLSEDDFREKLEEHLDQSGYGLIERMKIIKNKVQEFRSKKRKLSR